MRNIKKIKVLEMKNTVSKMKIFLDLIKRTIDPTDVTTSEFKSIARKSIK